jgi:hypothetical protein
VARITVYTILNSFPVSLSRIFEDKNGSRQPKSGDGVGLISGIVPNNLAGRKDSQFLIFPLGGGVLMTEDEKRGMIARFMGLEWDHYERLKRNYHTNWSELMPVVEKIRSLGYDVHIHAFKDNVMVGIDTWNGETIVYKKDSPSLIGCTYDAVATFIEWHKWHTSQPKN